MMNNIRHLKILIVLGGMLMFANLTQAGDVLYFDGFNMFADRSTLVIEHGHFEGNFAMKLTFGQGLIATKQIGIVYKESLNKTNEIKLNTAKEKLLAILNNSNVNLLRINKELSSDLGITFDGFINPEKINFSSIDNSRKECILTRRNIQQAVRGHMNIHSMKQGDTINWDDIIREYFDKKLPGCPSNGPYKQEKTYPISGKLAAECSNPDHDFEHVGW